MTSKAVKLFVELPEWARAFVYCMSTDGSKLDSLGVGLGMCTMRNLTDAYKAQLIKTIPYNDEFIDYYNNGVVTSVERSNIEDTREALIISKALEYLNPEAKKIIQDFLNHPAIKVRLEEFQVSQL